MKLSSVYEVEYAPYFLYVLLEQRDPSESISHKRMPTIEEHVAFMASRPYAAWYLLDVEHVGYVGAIYLTRQREIGVWVHKDQRGLGYSKQAIEMLMKRHPGRFLANIAPTNPTSQALFKGIGFEHIQETYLLEPK
jgi:RimJ/RimL family protein N-acetyltransferase